MNWEADAEIEAKLREALYNGAVDEAKEWLREIDNDELKDYLREIIREYEA